MTELELDAVLRAFVGEGADAPPQRLLELALATVHGTRQDRPPLAMPRWPSTGRAVSAWSAALAAVLVATIGLIVLQPNGPATPTSSPPPTSSPAPSVPVSIRPTQIVDPTIAATGLAEQFRVPFSYGLPDGWQITTETSSEVVFGLGSETVRIVDDALAPSCIPIDDGAPRGPADLVASMHGRLFIVPSASAATLGGLRGFDIWLTIRPAPGGPWLAPIYSTIDRTGRCSVVQFAVGNHRLFALDDGAGKTILIEVRGSSARFLAEAALVAESLDFDL